MSSISSITPAASAGTAVNQGALAISIKDFQSIAGAVQSGDVSAAQSALVAFQQSLPPNLQASSSQLFGVGSPANTDYQSLTNAIQSGDLTAAQKALASLQADLKATRKGHHHHHPAADPADSTNTDGTISTTSASTSPNGSLLNAVA